MINLPSIAPTMRPLLRTASAILLAALGLASSAHAVDTAELRFGGAGAGSARAGAGPDLSRR